MLTFDEPRHQYFYEGKPVLNVTRALGPLTDYSFVNEQDLLIAQQEGKATHLMVELAIKNDLDTLPPWLEPSYEGWNCFLRDTGFKPIHSELKVYSSLIRVAGTLDLFGRLQSHNTIIDIKRSLFAGRVIGLQTAGYARLLRDGSPDVGRVTKRAALILGERAGSKLYRLREYADPNDESVFLSAVTMYRWKHGPDKAA